jgi:polyisoprenyl-phosphate glycosyltransferase
MQSKEPNPQMKPISVIIPAYNEADRIMNVLSVLESIDYIEKIIVVDDGSKDATSPVVRNQQKKDPRIQLIQNGRNRGKGQSVFNAWEYCNTPYILMLDADLQGIHPEHIHQLCEPVLRDQADMTLGLFKGGQFATDFSHWAAPWLTGQRCMCSEILGNLPLEASRGYGIETAMTVLARQMHYRVKRVYLIGMSHPPGEIHRGGIPGLLNRFKMYVHIFRAWLVASSRKPEIRLQQPRRDSGS